MIECVFQIRYIIDFDVNTMLKFNWSQRKNKTMHGSMKRVLNIKVYTNKSNNKTKVINIVQTKGFRSLDSSVRDLLHYFKNMEWQKYISHCLTIYLALFDKKYSPVIKIVYVFPGHNLAFPVPVLLRCTMLASHSSETKNFGLLV